MWLKASVEAKADFQDDGQPERETAKTDGLQTCLADMYCRLQPHGRTAREKGASADTIENSGRWMCLCGRISALIAVSIGIIGGVGLAHNFALPPPRYLGF
jgi:hypothetical protein